VNREDCEIVSNIELMPGIYLMWLQAPEIARRAQAGQFVMVAAAQKTRCAVPSASTASRMTDLLYCMPWSEKAQNG